MLIRMKELRGDVCVCVGGGGAGGCMLKGLLKSQIHCSTFLQIIHMIPYSSLAISADGLKMKQINNLVFIFSVAVSHWSFP